jgi:cytochrome P450
VYKKLLNAKQFTDDEVFYDINSFLFAGLDTTSHTIASCLYLLKKHPEKYDKLVEELKLAGITKDLSADTPNLRDTIENCEYLLFSVKETLRLDPPLPVSIYYIAKDNIEICNIPVPKGTWIQILFAMNHLDPNEWQQPKNFIPERFDASSEYFIPPNNGKKQRHALSYIPFSHGARNCAGQALAYAETKVILARLLTRLEYNVDRDLLDNDHVRFNFLSHVTVKGKVKHKHS